MSRSGGGAIKAAGFQNFPGDFDIVEGMGAFARDLNFLVPLASEKNDVSGTRFGDGECNGFAAICLNRVFRSRFLQAHQRVINDRARILAPRIVRGEYDEITSPSCRLSHERALRAVPIAT